MIRNFGNRNHKTIINNNDFFFSCFSLEIKLVGTQSFLWLELYNAYSLTITRGCRGRDRDHILVWFYNYLCNGSLSPLRFAFKSHAWWVVLDTTLCDEVCQWLEAGWWFSPVTAVSSINKTDRHGITEILLKVVLNTITLPLIWLELYNM
jgi:hypothetical protein